MDATYQEKLIRIAGRKLFGGPLILRPHTWQAGDVCDALWVSGKVAILFYATDKTGSNNADKQFVRGVEHNLEQAIRNITYWQQGNIIIARNSYGEHNISINDIDRFIVVSVVKAKYSRIQRHINIERSIGCNICITLPEEVLKIAMKQIYSALDFISFIKVLADSGQDMHPADAIICLASYRFQSVQHLRQNGQVITEQQLKYKQMLLRSLMFPIAYDTRVPSGSKHPIMSGKPDQFAKFAELMADISLSDFYKLIAHMTALEAMCKEKSQPCFALTRVELAYYDLIIGCCTETCVSPAGDDRFQDVYTEALKSMRYKSRTAATIQWGMKCGTAVNSVCVGTDPTHLRLLLDV